MIDEAIRQILITDSAVAAVIASRVWPVLLPQSPVMPGITYTQISAPRVQSLNGSVGLVMSRYQVDCWAETYTEAKALAALVRVALDGYRGTVGSTRIGGVLILSERDLFAPDALYYQISLDFRFWHDE